MKINENVTLEVRENSLIVAIPNGGRVLLNESGSLILNKIVRGLSIAEVADEFCSSFSVERALLVQDIQAFLKDLIRYGVLSGQIDIEPAVEDEQVAIQNNIASQKQEASSVYE